MHHHRDPNPGPCLIFLRGIRERPEDKKGQKLTKSEGQSSKDARGVTFWSLPGQGSLHTMAGGGPPRPRCVCVAAQLGCGGGVAMYCGTDFEESEAWRCGARLSADTPGHRECV